MAEVCNCDCIPTNFPYISGYQLLASNDSSQKFQRITLQPNIMQRLFLQDVHVTRKSVWYLDFQRKLSYVRVLLCKMIIM